MDSSESRYPQLAWSASACLAALNECHSTSLMDQRQGSVVGSHRLAFALGQYPGRVEAGEDHDGPQESADHGPQHATAQSGATFWRIHLVGPLAEEVHVRER